MEFRPRASKAFRRDDDKRPESMTTTNDPNKPFSNEQRSITNFMTKQKNTNANVDDQCQTVSSVAPSTPNTIFHKVTNSFTGLFSNASWSEWIKSPLSSNYKEEEGHIPDISSTSLSSSNRSTKSFKELYPEEGIVDYNMSPVESNPSTSNSADVCAEKNFIPSHTDFCSFKRGHPIISSTPYAPSSVRKKEDFLCDSSVISKPGTSKLLTPEIPIPNKEESSYSSLLMKGHSNTEAERFPHTNGAFNRSPTARKRLRENAEEESADDGNDCGRGSKRGKLHTPSQSQLFSEVTGEEGPEAIQRRKRPRFSISAFGSPLFNSSGVQDEEEEETPQPYSLFYPGRVAFGGASNHRKRKLRIVPRKVLPRVAAAPAPNHDGGLDEGLSSVARRILHCIDKISTPLSDSKRALPFTTPRDISLDTSSFVADFHKHRPTLRGEISAPPINKLLTPSKVNIRKNISSLLEPKVAANFTSSKKETFDRNLQGRKIESETPTSTNFSVPSTQVKGKSIQVSSQRGSNGCAVESSLLTKAPTRFETNSVPRFSSSTESHSFPAVSAYSSASEKKQTDLVSLTKSTAVEPTEEDSYQFCKPEVVSSVIDTLPLTAILDETEFDFSPPIDETSRTPDSRAQASFVAPSGNWLDKFKPAKGTWDCDVCLLQNDGGRTECIACQSPKPTTNSTLTSASTGNNTQIGSSGSLGTQSFTGKTFSTSEGWGDAFKAPTGSWECGSCLIQNKPESSSCIACMTSKPQDKSVLSSTAAPQGNVRSSSGWGDLFKPPSGTWDCEMCLVQNKEKDTRCVACETPKPSRKEEPTSSSVSSGKSALNVPPAKETPQTESINNCWGDAFKPIKGSWECAVCLIQNNENASMCVACNSAKPKDMSKSDANSSLKEPSKAGFSSHFEGGLFKDDTSGRFAQDVFKASDNIWVCPECILTNQNSEDKCVGCKGSRPDITNDSRSSSRSQPSTGSRTMSLDFPKNYEGWSCETCLSWNKVALKKCANCQAPKVPLNPAIVSEAITGNFKFGVKPQPVKDAEVPAVTSTPSFFSSTNSQKPFSFGGQMSTSSQDTAEMKTATPSEESKFVWSNAPSPVTTTASSSPAFIFGNTTTTPTPTPTPAVPVDPVSAKPSENKTDTTDAVAPKPLFQFSAPAFPSPAQTLAKDPPPPAIPKLDVAKPAETKGSTPAPTGFSFGSQEPSKPASNSSLLSAPPAFNFFGSSNKAPAFPSFGPPSSFGAPATTTGGVPTTTTPADSTTTTTTTTSNSNKVNFSFNSAPQSTTLNFAFGQPSTKPLNTGFNFGEAAAKPPETSFNFGNSSVFQFGQTNSAATKPAEPAPPAFLNIEIAKSNPFNMTSSGAGPQRRPFKKAYRRNK